LALTIRLASEKDIAVLTDLSRKTFEEAFGDQNNPEDMRSYLDASFSVAQITHALTDPETTFLLAYHQDKLVGYAKIQGGPAPDCIRDDKAIQLSRVYIVSPHMGRGLGSQLIQACIDESLQQRYTSIWLGVWEVNVNARRLYERLGFVRVGTKKFILGSDVQQDAVYARSV
jgi:ribosomal protein S18 acetylase RimI-like enzyme